MKLLEKIKYINRIDFGDHTRIDKDRLIVNTQEIETFLKTKIDHLEDVETKIVRSSDKIRIFRVFDVIEPRMKLTPHGTDYPGVISKVGKVGSGETLILKNVAVVLIDGKKREWKPVIEHTESYGDISNYASLNLICVSIKMGNEIDDQTYHRSLYIAGLQLSVFLCYRNKENNVDVEDVYTDVNARKRQHKVGYFYQLCSAQYVSSESGPIFLGKTADNFLPIAITPTMGIDGALTRNFFEQGFETYSIQNNAIIYSLLKDEEIDFRGIVISISSMNDQDRTRNSLIAASFFKNFMDVGAVVMSKAFGGASNIDLEKTANELSEYNIVCVPIIQVTSVEEKLSDSLIFQTDVFKHLVCSGWTHEKVTLPRDVPNLFKPETLKLEGDLILEIEFIKGIIDNLGSGRLKVVEV